MPTTEALTAEPSAQTPMASSTIRIEFWHDEDSDPRDWDNFGTMVCWHRRYDLGSKHSYATPEDFLRDHKTAVMLPLYLYDHSGLSISASTSTFRLCDSAGWDWGQLGYIYADLGKCHAEWGPRFTKKRREAAIALLRSEVETYDQYLRGDVWGFTIYGLGLDVIDSCGGFYGDDLEENGMLDSIDPIYTGAFIEAWDNRY